MAKKPNLDEATRQIAERLLKMPPRRHQEMKIGKAKPKRGRRSAKEKPIDKSDR